MASKKAAGKKKTEPVRHNKTARAAKAKKTGQDREGCPGRAQSAPPFCLGQPETQGASRIG